jgi:hypothetical protein
MVAQPHENVVPDEHGRRDVDDQRSPRVHECISDAVVQLLRQHHVEDDHERLVVAYEPNRHGGDAGWLAQRQ